MEKTKKEEVEKEVVLGWHERSAHELSVESGSDFECGLSEDDAKTRLEKYGENKFDESKKESLFLAILKCFKDVSIIILVIAAILSTVATILKLTGPDSHGNDLLHIAEPIVIVLVIATNVFLSIYQEKSAEKSLAALQTLNMPITRVLRGNNIREVNTTQLVVGDIIELKTGDMVPADVRLISTVGFCVDESSLTGESEAVEKDANVILSGNIPLGDRINMAYSGCLVTAGNARALVVATGMNTEIGKIAGFLKGDKKRKTTLQIRMDKIGKLFSLVAVVAASIILGIGIYGLLVDYPTIPTNPPLGMEQWTALMMAAITLAVAAVPETLNLCVTLILSHGVKKMVLKNALIRKLPAVETLGSISVICSDKTGTLTMNKMSIQRLWIIGQDPFKDCVDFDQRALHFVKQLVLTSDATVNKDDNGNDIVIGDSTEKAIVNLAIRKDMNIDDIRSEYKRVGEIPFSSSRKLMSVILEKPDQSGFIVLTKGALDRLPINPARREVIWEANEVHQQFASDALRVISLGYKEVKTLPEDGNFESLESDLEFVGFIGIIDPPRPEASLAIKKARSAGIRTIMITGDHAITATAIAKQLGIIVGGEGVLTGPELNELSDEQLLEAVDNYVVYARVSPEDKIRIVNAWKTLGEVVVMTGDGVNDAPALKNADVGVAMGINGTEVAKAASDMVLVDDKFSTIIDAVSEGRNVFSNIRKLVYSLVVCNVSEVFVMIIAMFIFHDTTTGLFLFPLSPIMLLIINVFADGIIDIALAKEISDIRIMERRPIARQESFFGGGILQVIIQQIVMFVAATLLAYWLGSQILALPGAFDSVVTGAKSNSEAAHIVGQSMAFLVTAWTSVLHGLTVRSRRSLFTYRWKENPQIFIAIISMVVIMGALVAIPGVNSFLGFANFMSWQHWLIAIGLSFLPLIVAEYGKLWDFRNSRLADKNRVTLHR